MIINEPSRLKTAITKTSIGSWLTVGIIVKTTDWPAEHNRRGFSTFGSHERRQYVADLPIDTYSQEWERDL